MDKFEKAKGLEESDKVKYEGFFGSSLYFKVTTSKDHQVIFRVTNNRWMCDCEWSALHKNYCSHIMACRQWLMKREKEASGL
ncbi:MAG: hypothetical protein GOV01_01355 [Candidatus Altiarchaeota archaeon]|nr:hypothetical protein [Candidatus Altiarchaeota archaeon]